MESTWMRILLVDWNSQDNRSRKNSNTLISRYPMQFGSKTDVVGWSQTLPTCLYLVNPGRRDPWAASSRKVVVHRVHTKVCWGCHVPQMPWLSDQSGQLICYLCGHFPCSFIVCVQLKLINRFSCSRIRPPSPHAQRTARGIRPLFGKVRHAKLTNFRQELFPFIISLGSSFALPPFSFFARRR